VMKYNMHSRCALSLFLGAALLCGCNANPVTAMMLGVSDVAQNQKEPDRYINSDGGLGEVVMNDAWLVQEGFRRRQNGECSSSVDLQLVKQDLQSAEESSKKCRTLLRECEAARQLSDDRRSFCQKKNERCEKRSEELRRDSTATKEYFESEIADLKSQLANLEDNHTAYITALNKSRTSEISTLAAQVEDKNNQIQALQEGYDMCVGETHAGACANKIQEMSALLTAQKDDLKNQLEFQENQTESLQKSFAILQQQSSSNSNYMKATLGGGGFLLGAASAGIVVGRFVCRKILNRLEAEKTTLKTEKATLEQKLSGCEEALSNVEERAESLEKRVAELMLKNTKLSRKLAGASVTTEQESVRFSENLVLDAVGTSSNNTEEDEHIPHESMVENHQVENE
jgi:chromosome segregation ATPase